MKAPREGSRKADVFAIYKKSGFDAAVKKAVELGLKAHTVKAWTSAWKGLGPDPVVKTERKPRVKAQGNGAPKRTPKEPGNRGKGSVAETTWVFTPHFRHSSHSAAMRHVQAIMRRAGTGEGAYHIIEDQGHFAVVPISYKPGGPIPQFSDGDVVYDVIIPNRKGKVVKAGPEVCEVKYPEGNRYIPNYYLHVFKDDKKPAKRARVRT